MFIRIKKAISGLFNPENSGIKLESTITCPYCGFQQKEKMPLNACVTFYVCLNCKKVLRAAEGDCCIFCTYGDIKCPDKQKNPD